MRNSRSIDGAGGGRLWILDGRVFVRLLKEGGESRERMKKWIEGTIRGVLQSLRGQMIRNLSPVNERKVSEEVRVEETKREKNRERKGGRLTMYCSTATSPVRLLSLLPSGLISSGR